jgi:hypothetical protein
MMFVEKCFECLYVNKVEELHKEMNVYT